MDPCGERNETVLDEIEALVILSLDKLLGLLCDLNRASGEDL